MPPQVRVMAWVKPFAAYKVNVRVAYSWEPVIICPPQRLDSAHVHRDFGFDDLVELPDEVVSENITMKRGLAGAKPERFCFWLFNVLGLRPVDEFVDLFPGTRGVTAAWEEWCQLGGPKLKQTIKMTNDLVQANPFLAQ